VIRESSELEAAYQLLAEIHHEEGRPEEGLAAASEAVRIAPHRPRAHYVRGQCLLDLERFAEAEEAFDAVAALNPAVAVALLARAQRLLQDGHHEEARAACRETLRRHPGFAWALALEGAILLACDEPVAAVDALRRALEQAPTMAQAHYHLGRAYERLGQVREADICYREALRLNPLLSQAHVHLGHLSAAGKSTDDPTASYSRGIAPGVSDLEPQP
jgi:tetratricopeptide (TPR) repeat protein